MTCFWDGLLQKLNRKHYKVFNIKKIPRTSNDLIQFLKDNNRLTENVKIEGKFLSPELLGKNLQFVEDYDENMSKDGYPCTDRDPFLLLVSELFEVDIHHMFMKNLKKGKRKKNTSLEAVGRVYKYSYVGEISRSNKVEVWNVKSEYGHFWV